MSVRAGRWVAYLMLLWLATYVGTGVAVRDYGMAGFWIAFMATLLMLSASAMSAGTAETQSGSGLQPASAIGNAETPQPSSRSST